MTFNFSLPHNSQQKTNKKFHHFNHCLNMNEVSNHKGEMSTHHQLNTNSTLLLRFAHCTAEYLPPSRWKNKKPDWFIHLHNIHTHMYRRDTDPNTCVLPGFIMPLISLTLSNMSEECWVSFYVLFKQSKLCVLFMCCCKKKTYGGINPVTVLFNITSPRQGTAQQLENGASLSIKPTAVSYLIYSVLNTLEWFWIFSSTFYHTSWC